MGGGQLNFINMAKFEKILTNEKFLEIDLAGSLYFYGSKKIEP